MTGREGKVAIQGKHGKKNARRSSKAIWITVAVIGALIAMGVFLVSCGKAASDDQAITDVATEDTSQDVATGPTIPTEPFYVLLIGDDTRVGTAQFKGDTYNHGDILCLMRIDPKTYTVTLVTIPRDTRAVVNGSVNKINEALNVGGPDLEVSTVETLTGVKIDHYLMFDFITYEAFINAIGGITVDVPRTITVSDPLINQKVTVQAGAGETLDGASALVFARARDDYGPTNEDAYRQMNVRTSIMTIISKTLASDPTTMSGYLSAFDTQIQTDWDADEMNALVMDFAAHSAQMTIYSGTGPYAGDIDDDAGIWLVYPDDAGVWPQIMATVDAGGDPSGIVQTPDWADAA